MEKETYKHIIVPAEKAKILKYKYRNQVVNSNDLPERNPSEHAAQLRSMYNSVFDNTEQQIIERQKNDEPFRTGSYIKFEGSENYKLKLSSLDPKKQARLVNVHDSEGRDDNIQSALVFVESVEKEWLNDKINQYDKVPIKDEKRANYALIDSIEKISSAALEDFWDKKDRDKIPDNEKCWLEAWFYYDPEKSSSDAINKYKTLLKNIDIKHKENYLYFPERVVMLINANRTDLINLILSSDDINYFRPCQVVAGFIPNLRGSEQKEWIDLISDKVKYSDNSNVSVCVIDTGLCYEHPLIKSLTSEDECQAIKSEWGGNDRRGHGTGMAGIIAYGDLTNAIEQPEVSVPYRLSSIKLLPNSGENYKEVWGDYTNQAVSLAEIQSPDRNFVYCLAVTEKNGCAYGKQSSWSSEIDKICSEKDFHRLFIISGGNIDDLDIWLQYPDGNMLVAVHNPAQAWNALTVGAYTEKCETNDLLHKSIRVVAPYGGLSPFSSTSVNWENSTPIKPDIMMEGGNLEVTGNEETPIDFNTDLEMLTADNRIQYGKYFQTFNGTSAACAEAARYAALVMTYNPDFWPETIRGLFVHTASWTDEMIKQFSNKDNLLRCCGYGVPNVDRMLHSYSNGLTYIAQNELQPYTKGKSNIKYKEMHIYKLPWPEKTLLDIGAKEVILTITLSYFIEPGPGDYDGFSKYNYASVGLRFDLNNFDESEDQLHQRLSKRDEDEEIVETVGNNSSRWKIGIKKRTKGSVHKDYITKTAAELAKCNLIAVYPVSGWWKGRTKLKRYEDKIRYSLIISLDAPEVEENLYNEVQTQIMIPV